LLRNVRSGPGTSSARYQIAASGGRRLAEASGSHRTARSPNTSLRKYLSACLWI